MNRLKKLISNPVTTIILIILAVFLLFFSTMGGARAALTYYSETYASEVKLHDIGVTLVENGTYDNEQVAYRDYISETANAEWDINLSIENARYDSVILDEMLLQTNDVLIPGYPYKEAFQVRNSGDIDEYVRVTTYRYWVHIDEELITEELIAEYKKQQKSDVDSNKTISDENKAILKEDIDKKVITKANLNVYRFLRAYNTLNGTNYDLDDPLFKVHTDYLLPEAIDLNFINKDCWLEDEEARTTERNVFLYNQVLKKGETSRPLTDTLTIEYTLTKNTVLNETGIVTTYGSDGYYFVLELKVDAVQDHNAKDAINSAWGRSVSIDEATKVLTLVDYSTEDEQEEVQDEED